MRARLWQWLGACAGASSLWLGVTGAGAQAQGLTPYGVAHLDPRTGELVYVPPTGENDVEFSLDAVELWVPCPFGGRHDPCDPRSVVVEVVVAEAGADVVGGPGCYTRPASTGDGRRVAACVLQGVRRVRADLGDGNDRATVSIPKMPVVFNGGDGDDQLVGDEGADELRGGEGADTIVAQGEHDLVDGGAGDDDIDGGGGPDDIDGGADDDDIDGGGGEDDIGGGAGDDELGGGDGDDLLRAGRGADTVDGGAGEDLVDFAASDAAVTADLAVGTLTYGYGNGPISAGIAGVEHIDRGSQFDDDFFGDDGPNMIGGDEGDDVIDGRGGDDFLPAGGGADTVEGGAGRDFIDGGAGDDELGGGDGGDLLWAGHGADAVDGGAGRDTIDGDADDDRLSGGDGDDCLRAGPGADMVDGGAGEDLVDFAASDAAVSADLAVGTITYEHDSGPVSRGIAGVEHIDRGSKFDDTFFGDDGPNTIGGDDGDDVIDGRGGDDQLHGGWGKDILRGGGGGDVLLGGAGDDEAHAREGGPDEVRCGPEDDSVVGDDIDALADCEITDINHRPSEVAIRAPRSGTVGRAITFTGSADDPDGDPLTFTWEFGDGSTATGPTASHTYAQTGAFTVTVIVTDGRFGRATTTQTVTVEENQPPGGCAIAGSTGGAVGDPLTWTARCSDPDDDPLTFAWDFGDGSTAGGDAVGHAYAAAGTYTLTLTAADARGGESTATRTVTVIDAHGGGGAVVGARQGTNTSTTTGSAPTGRDPRPEGRPRITAAQIRRACREFPRGPKRARCATVLRRLAAGTDQTPQRACRTFSRRGGRSGDHRRCLRAARKLLRGS